MNKFLESTLGHFGVVVYTGTKNVEFDGEYVTGQWASQPTIIRFGLRPRAAAVELLNALSGRKNDSSQKAVLQFTRKYGPLNVPFIAGETFRFAIGDWKAQRNRLLISWKIVSTAGKQGRPVYIRVDGNNGDHFCIEHGCLSFRTKRLMTYMELEVASVPAQRLRKCANFAYGCESPYFFADDLRNKYCSDACSIAGKNRAKLEWWNENRKGGQDGTQKTR